MTMRRALSSATSRVIATTLGLVAAIPSALAEPVSASDADEPWAARDMGVLLAAGGGVHGYLDPDASDLAPVGGDWEARLTLGTRRILAAEVAYLGTAGEIDALGLDRRTVLVSNGAEAAVRVNFLPRLAVQPFLLAGIGYRHYQLTNDDFNTSSVNESDGVVHFPLGAGIAYAYERFTVDLRGMVRPVTDSEMFGTDAPAHSIAGTLHLGWEF